MSTLEHRLHAAVNVPVDGHQEMAGFAVSINGRFWVSTEVVVNDGIAGPSLVDSDVVLLGCERPPDRYYPP
jgi:hypothetical protein